MMEILLSSVISCSDAKEIAKNISSTDLSSKLKSELILEIKGATSRNCKLPRVN